MKYTHPVQIYLTQEDYERLKKYADDSDTDMSKMVRAWIRTKLNRRRIHG